MTADELGLGSGSRPESLFGLDTGAQEAMRFEEVMEVVLGAEGHVRGDRSACCSSLGVPYCGWANRATGGSGADWALWGGKE